MEQNIVLGNKRKFVFHFLSSLFFISAISLFEIGGIYSFINDKSKIGAFIQLISIFIAFLLFWRKKYIIPFDGMMRITYIFFLVICTFTVIGEFAILCPIGIYGAIYLIRSCCICF